MKATKVNADLAESNGRLLLGIWRDSLHVTCGLTACTPGSPPGPTLGNEYGKTLPFTFNLFINNTGAGAVPARAPDPRGRVGRTAAPAARHPRARCRRAVNHQQTAPTTAQEGPCRIHRSAQPSRTARLSAGRRPRLAPCRA